MSRPFPPLRLQMVRDLPFNQNGVFVVYWMHGCHRLTWSFALDRALEIACVHGKPLLILETLGLGDRWDSIRHHAFALAAMRDHSTFFEVPGSPRGVGYFPFVERAAGEIPDLLEHLCHHAVSVVVDEEPAPRHLSVETGLALLTRRCPVGVEAVDGSGLLPWRAAAKVCISAYEFRRFLQKNLTPHLTVRPSASPLKAANDHRLPALPALPADLLRRFPPPNAALLAGREEALRKLPIDREVLASPIAGGPAMAQKAWSAFLAEKLADYPEARNHPDLDGSSGLSPYLRHGQISVHQLFADLAARENWTPESLGSDRRGHKSGWWGMSEAAEAFLDELVTWRELGRNFSFRRDDPDRFESLPPWAQATLDKHADDDRTFRYDLGQFAAAATHDPLWNAAQRQLVREGRLHNYLRMLWGKKILEWSDSPREALATMLELNNRFALDGRDPNSFSGILWVLGRYDRPWGPERPIFGTIRYMSSDNTARKLKVRKFLAAHGAEKAAHHPA